MAYDTATYLLDRANIEDTIRKLTLYYDIPSAPLLVSEVFAPKVHIDYTSFLPGEPKTHDAADWAASLVALLDGLTTQHTIPGVTSHLPQPSETATRPDTVTAVANANGNLVREGLEGGSLLQNGGRYDLTLVRIPALEAQGQNPWRISAQRAVALWQSGNPAVLAGLPKPADA